MMKNHAAHGRARLARRLHRRAHHHRALRHDVGRSAGHARHHARHHQAARQAPRRPGQDRPLRAGVRHQHLQGHGDGPGLPPAASRLRRVHVAQAVRDPVLEAAEGASWRPWSRTASPRSCSTRGAGTSGWSIWRSSPRARRWAGSSRATSSRSRRSSATPCASSGACPTRCSRPGRPRRSARTPRDCAKTVGKGGGFMMCTAVGEMAGSDPELVKVWVDATREYGTYS